MEEEIDEVRDVESVGANGEIRHAGVAASREEVHQKVVPAEYQARAASCLKEDQNDHMDHRGGADHMTLEVRLDQTLQWAGKSAREVWRLGTRLELGAEVQRCVEVMGRGLGGPGVKLEDALGAVYADDAGCGDDCWVEYWAAQELPVDGQLGAVAVKIVDGDRC